MEQDAVTREQIRTLHSSLARVKAAWGEHSAKLLPLIFRLADTYFALGEYYAAEQLCWRALAISHKSFGDVHETVAECLQQLGEAQEAQGLIPEAERFYLYSLSVRQKCGKTMKELKPILTRLVLLYRNHKEHFKAKVMEYKLVQSIAGSKSQVLQMPVAATRQTQTA